MIYDFLVIGGGIAGISTAARLSHHGTTRVLEAEDNLAYHASGRSAAIFEENYGKPSIVGLTKASKDYHKTANGGVLSPRGFMMIGQAHEDAGFEADMTELCLDEIPIAEALDLLPILNTDSVTRAAVSPEALDIDTDLLIQNFARELRGNGGNIELAQRVFAVSKADHIWTVQTNGSSFQARHLVNAAGAWGDIIAEMAGIPKLGLTPYRRSVARIAAPGGRDLRKWPMLFGPGETWWAKPDAGAMIVSLAEETLSPPMDAWPHDIDLAEGLARYEACVTEPVTRPMSSWAGLRTFAPDRTLVLGPAPQDRSFIWVVGQGGYGFLTAPAASQLIADLMTGSHPQLRQDLVDQLSPDRFV